MHYAIFFPQRTGADPKHFESVGLAGLEDGAQFIDITKESIPAIGMPGMLAFWGDLPPAEVLREMTWESAAENTATDMPAGRFWIGWDPDELPEPTELARPKQWGGHWQTLNDGQDWLIPSYMRLEHVYRMGDNGQPVRRPAPQWEAFTRRSEEIQKGLFDVVMLANLLDGRPLTPDDPDTEVKTCTIENGLTHAAEALAINYRLNLEIALALNLFSDTVLPKVLAKTIDLPEILATHEEKKSADLVEIPVI